MHKARTSGMHAHEIYIDGRQDFVDIRLFCLFVFFFVSVFHTNKLDSSRKQIRLLPARERQGQLTAPVSISHLLTHIRTARIHTHGLVSFIFEGSMLLPGLSLLPLASPVMQAASKRRQKETQKARRRK